MSLRLCLIINIFKPNDKKYYMSNLVCSLLMAIYETSYIRHKSGSVQFTFYGQISNIISIGLKSKLLELKKEADIKDS